MINKHSWLLSDLDNVDQTGLTVFSTFACGGGSSMGYKRAGYTVVGANDIDQQMRLFYEKNLHPPFFIEAPIKELTKMDLPDEMFNLDVLDGSPPCSTFSMSGNREKDWGREKFFREGQAAQVLDDLFFDFLDVAERLQPRVIIAENVRGMMLGNAKGYLRLIQSKLTQIRYKHSLFLINSAFCGVPQRRERIFICALRGDIEREQLKIICPYKETISVSEAFSDLIIKEEDKCRLSPENEKLWILTKPGQALDKATLKIKGKPGNWNHKKLHSNQPSLTITASGDYSHWNEPRTLTIEELIRLGSFPDDYNFMGNNARLVKYLIGMSVPPKMTEVVAAAVRDQWLLK